MATGRKQVAFDLDTKALEIYYPTESWNNAYEVIKRHMQNNGFIWQQGSVYVSEKPIPARDVTQILDALVEKNSWLNVCMRDCRLANISKEHSQNQVFDKKAKVPTRSELQAKKKTSPKAEQQKPKGVIPNLKAKKAIVKDRDDNRSAPDKKINPKR